MTERLRSLQRSIAVGQIYFDAAARRRISPAIVRTRAASLALATSSLAEVGQGTNPDAAV